MRMHNALHFVPPLHVTTARTTGGAKGPLFPKSGPAVDVMVQKQNHD